jgi:integrase
VAYSQKDEGGGDGWRARYKRPDGTWGSRSGFTSSRAAEDWGDEQEALIRRNLWLDPKDGETPFGRFAEEYLGAVLTRREPNTIAKYRSFMDNHLLPQWSAWPLIGIFNSYVEIEKWVSELHEDYAESTVASIFAAFSMFMNAAVRARHIPANPCYGVKVTSGAFETEHLVASPVQGLRAAMRLYASGLGLSGFTLCLMDFYTGGRWGELVGQQRHEYDAERCAISIREPLKESGGKLSKGGRSTSGPCEEAPEQTSRRGRSKKGRTKTPAGTRWVDVPPSIAVFYEILMDSHRYPFVLCTPEGKPWRRSNFRARHWRPTWDGVDVDRPDSAAYASAILPTFTFHEGRHTHSTWLTEDGVPEVARRARLGHKMKGMARVYDHVTPTMQRQIIGVLEARWLASLVALTPDERVTLAEWFPHLRTVFTQLGIEAPVGAIAISSPFAQ